MQFEWDPDKDRANRENHGLSFAEAAELFTGGLDWLEVYDGVHSDDEDRFIALGWIDRGIIVVAFTEPRDDVIRIVSARKATKRERTRLEACWRGKDERRDS